MTTSLEAARATNLIQHSHRCISSGMVACICALDARMGRLAEAFQEFRDGVSVPVHFGEIALRNCTALNEHGVEFNLPDIGELDVDDHRQDAANYYASAPSLRHFQEDESNG